MSDWCGISGALGVTCGPRAGLAAIGGRMTTGGRGAWACAIPAKQILAITHHRMQFRCIAAVYRADEDRYKV